MIIENLITGIAEGWFNSKGKHSTLPFSERHDIEHKNLVLRNPQFEKNNKVDLNQFKIKPFIFLENQDVIIYDTAGDTKTVEEFPKQRPDDFVGEMFEKIIQL